MIYKELESKQEAGKKYDAEKPRLDLLDREALVQIANVLSFGAKKYDAHNWRKGMSWSRLIAAALRHIEAFNEGENRDPETGLSHLAHAGCCIMFLLNYQKTHPELDDRYYPVLQLPSEDARAGLPTARIQEIAADMVRSKQTRDEMMMDYLEYGPGYKVEGESEVIE